MEISAPVTGTPGVFPFAVASSIVDAVLYQTIKDEVFEQLNAQYADGDVRIDAHALVISAA